MAVGLFSQKCCMSFLLGLKAKAIATGVVLLTIAGFLLRLKVVTHQRDRARVAQKTAETQRDQVKDQSKLDRDIRDKRAVKRRQTIKEVEQGEVPNTLSDDLNTW